MTPTGKNSTGKTRPGRTRRGDKGTGRSPGDREHSDGTRIDHEDPVVVIIGSGAGGGTLAHQLTAHGVSVVLLEAGPHLGPDEFVNHEWGPTGQLTGLHPGTVSGTSTGTASGSWRVAQDFPHLPVWSVKAVGGSTTQWAGATPRILEHELRALSTYGAVADAALLDWPLTLAELTPYYDLAEIALSSRHRTPASWSTLVQDIPQAQATGNLDLRSNSHAVQITHDRQGRADSVLYLDAHDNMHQQRARIVAVAGNAVETPRLLMLSASTQFPDGLANSSGQLGRNYMRHTTGSVFAQFERPVHVDRGATHGGTMARVMADEARHDPERGFVGGYYLHPLALSPAVLAMVADPGAWGHPFTQLLENFTHTAGLCIVGEDMPCPGNRVTLNDIVTDAHGLPVANVHVDEHPNDTAMRQHGYQQADLLYAAVGARSTHHAPPFPSIHNLGTARMSVHPDDGVTNSYGRTHDVPNLFISDGSVFTTSTAASPTLTIVALAMRQADYIRDLLSRGQL